MSDLRELYQELIIDHGRHPRNFCIMEDASVKKEGFNPLCGDRLTLYLKIENDHVIEAAFQGSGCAISVASASMMTDVLKGKSVGEAKKLFTAFHQLVTGHVVDEILLGKLAVLKGVSEFPARVKCASLAWHTMVAAIEQKSGSVSTE